MKPELAVIQPMPKCIEALIAAVVEKTMSRRRFSPKEILEYMRAMAREMVKDTLVIGPLYSEPHKIPKIEGYKITSIIHDEFIAEPIAPILEANTLKDREED